MNRSSCNIADIMMTHKFLNLEKSGKIRGNLCLHWKVKWTTTTKRIYPQEISFNCLSSKRMEKISTCVLPSIKNHHLSNMKPRFRGFCWMIWNCRFGLIAVTCLSLDPTYFVFLLSKLSFKSVDSLGENVLYFKKGYVSMLEFLT